MKTLASKMIARGGGCIQWVETETGARQMRISQSGRVIADLTASEMVRELATMPAALLTEQGKAFALRQRNSASTGLALLSKPGNSGVVDVRG